ncbi:MAG: ImmA/IrrE family metallo-endopeptidase [Pseudomonadota bacterium]
MNSPKKKRPIPDRRRRTIIEISQAKREKQVGYEGAFDPIRYVEHVLPKEFKNFDFDYWSGHPAFLDRPDRKAFVDFTDGIQLFIREEVMDGAYRGDNEDRFAISHEIGHVYLHRNKAKTILSRHSIGSRNQYSGDPVLEYEANLFGGTLLAPPSGISPLMGIFDVRRRFRCSQDVAERAIKDAEFWRSLQRKD